MLSDTTREVGHSTAAGLTTPIEFGGVNSRFDPDKYIEMLRGFDLSDADAQTLLGFLETVVRGWVEFGWSGEVCGQLLDGFQDVLSNAVLSVDSEAPHTEEKGPSIP